MKTEAARQPDGGVWLVAPALPAVAGRFSALDVALSFGRSALGPHAFRLLKAVAALLACLWLAACQTPIGVDRTAPSLVYRQTHINAVSHGTPSPATAAVLRRFDQEQPFEKNPQQALALIHQRAVENQDRSLLYALSELNYLAGDRLRRSVKPWEPADARDHYLASAVYAWLFLFGQASDPAPDAFDQRFRMACDFYNFGLGWAVTGRRGTNAEALLQGGDRALPFGGMTLEFEQPGFPWPLEQFEQFLIADRFTVRGLSVRNRQAGLGAPLVGLWRPDPEGRLLRTVPATVLLRVDGGWAGLAEGHLRGSLELHAAFDEATVRVDDRVVPLESDTTVALATALNEDYLWRLGRLQFLSAQERVPTGVYLTQPYRAGRIPVVFVHGTFSSPTAWAEMANTLDHDPVLRQRCQFWYFFYNTGNPTIYSAVRLRDALTEKLQEVDPLGSDGALRQMVVIGHSQGGLLTKLTATDTGEKLLEAVLQTNRVEALGLSADQEAILRHYTCLEGLPCVKRVVFISTPHRGSYAAGNLARKAARKLVSLPGDLVQQTGELAGLSEKLDLPKELRGTPTSIDSMSPDNPVLLVLADIPLAPGIKGHSIVAVEGDGNPEQGKDGLVNYGSAHVDYVESELVVRSVHSCQNRPECIEEVRRILHEHLAASSSASSPGAHDP